MKGIIMRNLWHYKSVIWRNSQTFTCPKRFECFYWKTSDISTYRWWPNYGCLWHKL